MSRKKCYLYYFITVYRDKRQNEIDSKKDSLAALKLLKLEIKIHQIKLNNLLKQPDLSYEEIIRGIKSLSWNIWEKNYSRLIISDELFEKFHKYYISLEELASLNESELFAENKKYIEQQADKSNQAMLAIDKEIANIQPVVNLNNIFLKR